MSWYLDIRDRVAGRIKTSVEDVLFPVPPTQNPPEVMPLGVSGYGSANNFMSSPYMPLVLIGGALLLFFIFRGKS